jgi:hypothetical protein
MTAKTTRRRTALSGALGSKALERLLIVAAVAAVLVAFGAWYAMGRPAGADAAGATSSATAGSSAAPAPEVSTPSEAPVATTPAPPAPATETPVEQAGTGATAARTTAAAPAPATPFSPTQTFLDEVSDSGLAPPVDDAQKLAMARDVCDEMGYGATPEDVTRALTFAGATDAEAANFVQLAIANVCPEHAGR